MLSYRVLCCWAAIYAYPRILSTCRTISLLALSYTYNLFILGGTTSCPCTSLLILVLYFLRLGTTLG